MRRDTRPKVPAKERESAYHVSTNRPLVDILDLATCWNTILLIDEADAFLEQRSNNDLQRNGLVSVFLRLLEYYEGVMFLTTNRMKAFDTAFKSRVHLAVNYPSLSDSSQRELWLTFLTNDSQRPRPLWLTESLLEGLTEKVLNGRQIKNVVRTASARALADSGRDMQPKDILVSLKAMKEFEADFAEAAPGYNYQSQEDQTSAASGHGLKRRRVA